MTYVLLLNTCRICAKKFLWKWFVIGRHYFGDVLRCKIPSFGLRVLGFFFFQIQSLKLKKKKTRRRGVGWVCGCGKPRSIQLTFFSSPQFCPSLSGMQFRCPPWLACWFEAHFLLFLPCGIICQDSSLWGTLDFLTCLREQREVTSKILVNCTTLPPFKPSQ